MEPTTDTPEVAKWKRYPRKKRRITVQVEDEQHLDRLCAPTSTRGKLTVSQVVNAALAGLPSPGHAPDVQAIAMVLGLDSSGPCERVHLSDVEAHKMRVELAQEGRNLMQLVRRANSGQTVLDDEVVERLREQRALLDELIAMLGGSS